MTKFRVTCPFDVWGQNWSMPFVADARTLACILIVVAHVNLYLRGSIELFWPVGSSSIPVLAVAMPVFLMLSGYSSSTERRRVSRLTHPFIFWSIAFLFYQGLTSDLSISGVIDTTTGYVHLYYLFVLGQILLLDYLFGGDSVPPNFAITLTVSAVLTAASYSLSDLLVWTESGSDEIVDSCIRKSATTWALFYFIGTRLGNQTLRAHLRKHCPALGGLTLIAYALHAGYINFEIGRFGYSPRPEFNLCGLPFQLVCPMFILSLLPPKRPQGRAARDTYGIYLLHVPILMALAHILYSLDISLTSWATVPVISAVVWAFATLIVRSLRRTNVRSLNSFLIGERP